MTEEQSHILWSKNTHNMMRNGGVWTVPRSGLMFTRNDNGFELNMVMPFTNEMAAATKYGKDVPPTAAQLLAYQQTDFRCIQRHFKAAGLEISDPKGILGI